MQSKIENIILDTLQDLNEELNSDELENPTKDTKLFGGDGALDSLSLVLFITDLEEKISDEFNKEIVLADERAMSRKTSPFRSVQSLSIYVQNLLEVA